MFIARLYRTFLIAKDLDKIEFMLPDWLDAVGLLMASSFFFAFFFLPPAT